MGQRLDQAPLDRAPEPGEPEANHRRGRRWWRPSQTTVWVLAVVIPLAIFTFTQTGVAQNAEGWFVRGLVWDIGRKEIVADIVAPIWVLSIVVVAALERRMLHHYGPIEQPPGAAPVPILTDQRVYAATWGATIGAVLCAVMSLTREWERFDEQPEAFWLVLTIVATLGLLAIPLWWARHQLFNDAHTAIRESATGHRISVYLFDEDDRGGPRWLIIFTFAALTGFITSTVLGQLDALLKGMRPSGGVSVGMNGLSSIYELDLSQKPGQIIERVGSWATYADEVGSAFASGFAVATSYLTLETVIFIPAYTVCIGILLLWVRRTPPQDLSASAERSYELVIGIGFLALVTLITSDLVENLMTWVVIEGVWNDADSLGRWTVRLMWFASLFRTLALVALAAVAVFTIAFRASRYRWIGDALVAVRGQILVVLFLVLALGIAQTEDTIRRWTTSIAFLTVAMVTALAVVIEWSTSGAMNRLRAEKKAVDEGEPVEPATVTLPWSDHPTSLRTVVVASIFVVAALQVVLVGALGFPAGLGFAVASALIAVVWFFGIPLPSSEFMRGDRTIESWVMRWFPRILGAAVFLVLGIVVIRAATTQLVYARHADPWLVFCLVPIALGVYRIHTKSWSRMGELELIVMGGTAVVGIFLWITRGDPELSPVALVYLGLLLAYGSMPFYFSYSADSLPSRFITGRLPGIKIRPLIIAGAVVAVVTSAAIIVWPLVVPGRIGTVAVVLLGALLFAGFAAAAVAYAEVTRPPKILAAFRLKRTPVFIFMFVWIAAAGIASTGSSNDVAVLDRTGDTAPGDVVMQDVWDRWVVRNAFTTAEDEAIPLVMIASSGGGIRAAAWTSYVLDCVFTGAPGDGVCGEPRDGAERIALMSGVSGGSLGLASWSASIADPASVDGSDDWVKERLGDDYLAGAMAWLLLVDTPRSFIGFGPDIRDRAEIMELTFESSWSGDGEAFLSQGMFDLWDRYGELPLMVFNGTSVNDPCRFNTSVLSATAHEAGDTCTSLSPFENRMEAVERSATLAATQDLADYLCPGHDLKLSTAVLLTARFPIVTPSGRLGGTLSECSDEPIDAYVVDGGYLEGSGAGTISELWQRLESNVEAFNATHDACIVPFLIQIDNGYENPGAAPLGTSPIEVLVPVRTLLSSQFGRIANAREHAAIEFDRPLDIGGEPVVVLAGDGVPITSRYARITTRAHPGVQAPLGWTLSNTSFDDLKSQLSITENRTELAEIQRWLSGGLTCQDQEQGE